ncbi:hypothetical protein NDU88_011810 [Pleurodeles waltl]|uniref:Uncharacterized protein n=1 Tax=Pleurodeles waltl TaxID=8319 RepID=A0AAV7R063_PLEWA|nr:hypothetical protein NDU88_011810 [Pleurodeles waltl]
MPPGPTSLGPLLSLTRSAGPLPMLPVAPPVRLRISDPLVLTARSGAPRRARQRALAQRRPTPPGPRAHRRAPGLLSRAPAISAHPLASQGVQEAVRRGHNTFSEARAAELAETRPLTPPSWPRPLQ